MGDEKLIINLYWMYILCIQKCWWVFGHFLQYAIFCPLVGRFTGIHNRVGLLLSVKMCYCVIVYVCHFWPPNLRPISVWSLLYTPDSLIFMTIFPVFHCAGNICAWVSLIVSGIFPRKLRAQCANKGNEGGVMQGMNSFMWVCAQILSGAQYIAPIRGPIMGNSPVNGPSGDWGGKLRRSWGSTNSQTLLRYGCWPIHVHVKGVTQCLLPRVDYN